MAADQYDQKHDEKHDEKRQEKGIDEKYRRNPLGALSFAFLLVWLGVILLLQNTGAIKVSEHAWAIFFWGGGGLIVAETIVRLATPRWRRAVMGSFIWGAVWIGVGFGLWFGNWDVIGPLVLIAVGLGILVGRFSRRR
jgi:hypothetical protein